MRGKKVGSYIIEDKLGEGGMGVVYSAQHTRMSRRAVVKVLREQFANSPEISKRFENEANAAASIGHPGIVQVFDIGQHEEGFLYIVMELLVGEGLQERLERIGKLPVAQAVSVIQQAADALGAAHKIGIVHRDLKPDNMFMVPDALVAGGERVKLLDFGIAKLAGENVGLVTATGAMMGTPHYMSPEQCRGAGGVDHRSDLYALGCILFQLLTGRTPFVGVGGGDFIVAHLTQEPPLVRSLAPAVSAELEDVVSQLLVKDPDHRLATTDALIAALTEAAPTLSRADSHADRAAATSTLAGVSAAVPAQATPAPRAVAAKSAGASASPAVSSAASSATPSTTLGVAAAPIATAPDVPRAQPKRGVVIAGVVAVVAVVATLLVVKLTGNTSEDRGSTAKATEARDEAGVKAAAAAEPARDEALEAGSTGARLVQYETALAEGNLRAAIMILRELPTDSPERVQLQEGFSAVKRAHLQAVRADSLVLLGEKDCDGLNDLIDKALLIETDVAVRLTLSRCGGWADNQSETQLDYLSGLTALDEGKLTEARSNLRRAWKKGPSSGALHIALAQHAELRGNLEAACQHYATGHEKAGDVREKTRIEALMAHHASEVPECAR